MLLLLLTFLKDEAGQDLTEYSLLIVFILLAIIGLAAGTHNSIAGVASITNSNLDAASTTAAS